MNLIRTQADTHKRNEKFANGFLLGDTNMVVAIFKTDPKVVKQILPPPLKPAPEPLGSAYVAEFQTTNFGIKYNEAAVLIQAQYKGEIGNYCLAMPVDNDIAMMAGREVYGFPKKIADSITLARKGNQVTGTCIRHGIPIIEITANIQTPFPEQFTSSPYFLLKAFPSIDGLGVDEHPRLLRLVNKVDYGPIEIGPGVLKLNESAKDPLYEIPVNEVTTTAYATQTNIWLQPATVLTELTPDDCIPYFFTKYDWDL